MEPRASVSEGEEKLFVRYFLCLPFSHGHGGGEEGGKGLGGAPFCDPFNREKEKKIEGEGEGGFGQRGRRAARPN